MTYLAPAKLNLGLKIVGKREDGYHLLRTIFCLIDLFDEIQIQTTDNGKISLIEHNQGWPYYADLAYKAAVLLQEISNTKLGANIKINKVIPAGGGLGGGSSNAATVLSVLNNLWQTNLNKDQLAELGKSLGADIPFFLHGKNASAQGIGDIFTDINIPTQYFVLIFPSFYLNTASVFKSINYHLVEDNISDGYLLETLENDLLDAAIKCRPELQLIINELSNYGKVAMTGSGSTLYLRFDSLTDAKKVAKKIAVYAQSKYNTYLVKSLEFSPVSLNNF